VLAGVAGSGVTLGAGVTLGGGVTVGAADGLAGGAQGEAGTLVGLALHAANPTTTTREAASARLLLDIGRTPKVVAVEAASAVTRRRANGLCCARTNVHNRGV
jgi:hypothetical protein